MPPTWSPGTGPVHDACGGENESTARGRAERSALREKVRAKGGRWLGEETLRGKSGRKYRPDVITPKKRILELKPRTPSGIRQGRRQAATYERELGMRVRLIFY